MPHARRFITATAASTITAGLLLGTPSAAKAAPAPALAPVPQTAPVPLAPPLPTVFHATPSIWTTVSYGAHGATVERIQRIVGTTVDGSFGPLTLTAVKKYQTSHHLVPDGIVGPLTAAAMKLTTATTTTPTPVPTTPPVITTWNGQTVSYGDRGGLVPTIQSIVGVPSTGSFDWTTVLAVKRYQGSHGLEIDGIVGPLTAAAMGLTGAPTPPPSRDETRPPITATAAGIIAIAQQYTGIWYLWGGNTTAGFDCSGYVQFVFAKAGIALPRTAAQIQAFATRVSTPSVGDLVFIGYPAHHVGIYAGDGYFYDSGTPGTVTQKRKIWTTAVTYGRVL